MSGCRCQCGSSRTMLSRRCADEGGGLRLQFPALGLALARAAGDVLAARSRVSVDVPGQTWHIPGVDVPRTPARPAWLPVPGPAAGRGVGHSRAAARTRSPSARRVAAPTARPVPPPGPSPRPSSASLPQARSCGTPEPPRSVTSTRTTPPAARTATVTVSPAALEPLCRTLLANSSLTSSAAPYSPGCPGPGTPAVNARATRACSARPPSRSPGQPPWPPADPPCPARPAARETTRGRSRAHGDARPARRLASSPGYAAGAARPWPSVKQPTVRTDRDEAPIPSAMRPWTPRHVDPQ